MITIKTLIFNGSPHKNGDTSFLLNLLKQNLNGEVIEVNTYNSTIKGCCDCRYCFKNTECCVNDDMQTVYEHIIDCDNIIIASPVYFSELTGSLLNVMSRLQRFYAVKRFQSVSLITKTKRGGIILCGGGDGNPQKAVKTATTLLKCMNASALQIIISHNTDDTPASEDEKAINGVITLADKLNK